MMRLAISLLLLGCTIEYLQSVDFLGFIGQASNPLAVLVLGSVFDLLDILAYTLGITLSYMGDRLFIRKYSSHSE
jgi:glycopeptide antibiotics resistance protein